MTRSSVSSSQECGINRFETRPFIELISIYTRQVILAGDEAQKENPSGLGAWTNLRKSSPFYQEGTLSIHKLRHNFRQTYELGNISYNYRQLLLGDSVEDLSADYFDNQKGFPIPTIVHKDKFESLVREKLKYIADVFTVKFPLVVICNSHHEQQQTIGLLKGLGIRTSAEDSVGAGSTEVVVITVNEIAGREFPVAISILPDAIESGTVYIILSRAKFDLTLVIGTDFKMDEYLVRLEQLKMLRVR